MTAVTRDSLGHHPKNTLYRPAHLTMTMTLATDCFLRTRFRPRPVARITRREFAQSNVPLHAPYHFFKRNFYVYLDIRASLGTPAATPTPAEQIRKDVFEASARKIEALGSKIIEIEASSRALSSPALALTMKCFTRLIVAGALLLVGEHLIGLVDLLKLFLVSGALVGMILVG